MATALNATVSVDSTPDRTRTHAHIFLVERVTLHSCALCMAQDVLGWQESASSFCVHFHLEPWCRYYSFPHVLSSPTGSRSRPSASTTSLGWSFREKPCEPARWSGMYGRLATPAPNTGYEPNPSNFFSYVDMEHTPIHLADNHHDFQCQDDATVISTTDPWGLPRSGASSSSKQTAASRVRLTFGLSILWKQMSGHVSSPPGLQETETMSYRESVATTIFSSQLKWKRLRHKRCAFAERYRKSPKHPWTESWLGRPRRDDGLSEFCLKLRNSDFAYQEISQEFASQGFQLHQASRWADQAQRDKLSLYGESELRNRLFQNNHARDCQEIEELRSICCLEADRARQARSDELSMQQERNPTTVSQRMAQIRELQNKANSLSDAGEFLRFWIREQLWSDPRSRSSF